MKRNNLIKRIAAAALFLICILVLASCGGNGNAAEEENPLDAGTYDDDGNWVQLAWYPDAKMNDLQDDLWTEENGFRKYKGSGYTTHTAIDVSSGQDVIDWQAVKNAGVEYAIMRVGFRTYGSGIIKTDECCYWNLKEAKKVGLKTGVYFFTQALNEQEAEEEAQFVLDMIRDVELDLPIFYDTESINYDTARTDSLSGEQLTKNAIAFCEYIKSAGYTPGIYANQMWLCNHMDLMQLEQYEIWLAKYAEKLNYPYELMAWQYTSEGKVDGISGVVDMDVIIEKK